MEAQHKTYTLAVEERIRKEFFPDRIEFSPELYQHILTTLEAAEKYAFLSRKEGWQFVRVAARHGWNFHEQPPFRKILEDATSSRQEKLEALLSPGGKPV